MKYKIYELKTKVKFIPDGYDTKKLLSHKLSEFEYNEEFESLGEAEDALVCLAKTNVCKSFVILPTYEIDYEGNIR